MKQLWKIEDIEKRINTRINSDIYKMIQAIYTKCISFANRAKEYHTYNNYKGELESSIGVVVLKDRNEVMQWSSMSIEGTDPSKGLDDFKQVLSENIIGKSELPDGTEIPSQGIVGIVFAAAPYAYMIENGQSEVENVLGEKGRYGKTVLNAFSPKSEEIFRVLKVILS